MPSLRRDAAGDAGQTEDAEEITVVEGQFVVITHERTKYECVCKGCVERRR